MLSSIDFPGHGKNGSAICGDIDPMSLSYPFDFPCQQKNWLRVQKVDSKLHCFR